MRIKFYSSSDLSTGYHFDRLKEIIETIKKIELNSLLDILEAHNILKFLNANVYPAHLSSQQIKEAKSILNRGVNQYFEQVSKENILDYIKYFFSPNDSQVHENLAKKMEDESLDKYSNTLFREDFLECFEKYKLSEKFVEDDLRNLTKEYHVPVGDFLNTKYFIAEYPILIKELFLENSKNFELLLNNYTDNETQYIIPDSITREEMYQLCENYIEDEFANLNYIRLISQGIQGIRELTIDAKLKLKARRKEKQLEQKIFQNKDVITSKGINRKIAVYTEKEHYNNANEEFKSLIDLDFLKKENSTENLLEYMMYLEDFFTENWILNLCSFPNFESSTFVRTLTGIYTKKNYETSFYFSNKNYLILLSFKVFQEKLGEIIDSRIENLISYFFSNYSKENYNIDWLPLDFASKSEKINIQTKNLFTIEEQIRKQWKLLVEENEVDQELFELENTPPIKQLKSLLEKKYIYANEKNENIQTIIHLLFSDQSNVTYINEELKESNFVKLIMENKVKKSCFHNYQQPNIDFLVNNNVISLGDDGIIFTTEKQLFRISILSNIYKYEVVHYYHWNQKLSIKKVVEAQQHEKNEMLEEGLLIYETTLFARPEVDFLNYILNNSVFDNALGLRNKYLHGSIVEDNYQDYLYSLIILVVYVVKINEEFDFYEDIE